MSEAKQTIWKFETKVKDTFSLDLPEGSTFVHAAPTTGGVIAMWFMVFPEKNKLTRKFYIVGTGQTVPEDGVYLATVVDVVGPPYVWHLFQQARNTEGLGW